MRTCGVRYGASRSLNRSRSVIPDSLRDEPRSGTENRPGP
jgi:hypothetical protein